MNDGNSVGRRLSVLVVAPEIAGLAPLGWIRELGGLAQVPGVTLEMVAGPDVTPARVAAALQARRDVVIWSGHGQANGLVVCRGNGGSTLVRSRWIAAQVRGGAPRVLVLAACGSECADPDGDSLVGVVSRSGVNVVGFPEELLDGAAVTYSVEFVRAMAAGSHVGDAHEVAREVVADGWPEMARGVKLFPGLTDGLRAWVDRLERLEAGQARVERALVVIAGRMGVELVG